MYIEGNISVTLRIWENESWLRLFNTITSIDFSNIEGNGLLQEFDGIRAG